MRIATAQQMRDLDHMTIHDRGVPSDVLMERAAQGILTACLSCVDLAEGKRAAVFCGAGNNGGDGVAVARLLLEAGLTVRAFLVGRREKMTDDCREMERRLNAAGGTLEDFDPVSETQRGFSMEADVLVDALFGIGLNSDIR